jgi:hypothetical protein
MACNMEGMSELVEKRGEGFPSTGAVCGSQAVHTVSLQHYQGLSGVHHQAPECVDTPGEASGSRAVAPRAATKRVTRGTRNPAEDSEFVFLPPATTTGAAASARRLLARARSDDEESAASCASSVASTASRGKKRRLMPTIPDVPEELPQEVRTSSAADVNAEFNRHILMIMRVAMTSTNLKGTYVKNLREAATYITAAWKYDAPRKAGAAQDATTTWLAEARMMAQEEEIAALRQELSRRAACAHECSRSRPAGGREPAGAPGRAQLDRHAGGEDGPSPALHSAHRRAIRRPDGERRITKHGGTLQHWPCHSDTGAHEGAAERRVESGGEHEEQEEEEEGGQTEGGRLR